MTSKWAVSWWWGWFTLTSKKFTNPTNFKGHWSLWWRGGGFRTVHPFGCELYQSGRSRWRIRFHINWFKLVMSKKLPLFCMFFWNVSPNILGWRYIFFLVLFHHAAKIPSAGFFQAVFPSCFCQLGIQQIRKDAEKAGKTKSCEILSSWWFQRFLYVHPYLGRWSNLTIIFFGWVGKNHQLVLIFGGSGVPKNTGDAKYLGSPACLW